MKKEIARLYVSYWLKDGGPEVRHSYVAFDSYEAADKSLEHVRDEGLEEYDMGVASIQLSREIIVKINMMALHALLRNIVSAFIPSVD